MKKYKGDKQNANARKDNSKEKDASVLENILDASSMKEKMTRQNMLIFLVLGAIVLLIFFQYRYERQQQAGLSSESFEEEEDYYQVLGLEPNADLKAIRSQYKKLAKALHPDKHPGCKNCKEKFNKLSEAHNALTKDFDARKKNRSIFNANPFIITVKNYHRLVEQSNDLWILLAYEQAKNDQYMQSVAAIFDESTERHKTIIKFGVIEIIKEEKLIPFLPFKMQHFPCIFTYLFGENSEMMDNIDNFTPNSLNEFIQKSYVSKVKLVETGGIIRFNSKNGKEKPIPSSLSIKDMETSFFISSPKNYIDLVAKDFAKVYHENSEVLQNDLGFYDDAIKILNAKNNNKVFVSFYTIDKDKRVMVNKIKAMPMSFNRIEEMSLDLDQALQLGKTLNVPQLFKNNYAKHCQRKQYDYNREADQADTDIDICIVELGLGLKETNDLNEGFYSAVIENFYSEVASYFDDFYTKELTDKDKAYKVHLYFGKADVKKHENLNKLYTDYYIRNEMALRPRDNSKVFLIINKTHERFVFKIFIDGKSINEYFKRLRDPESFEDMEFSFLYLSDFSLRDSSMLFNEQKIFSVIQITSMAFATQMQFSHIALFLLLFITDIYLFKNTSSKSMTHVSIAFCISFICYVAYYTVSFFLS